MKNKIIALCLACVLLGGFTACRQMQISEVSKVSASGNEESSVSPEKEDPAPEAEPIEETTETSEPEKEEMSEFEASIFNDEALDCRSVRVLGRTLFVELQSEGEGWNTLEDTQAINHIYSIAHVYGKENGISNVSYSIYHKNSDDDAYSRSFDIEEPFSSEELLLTIHPQGENITESVRIAMEEYFPGVLIESMELADCDVIEGKSLILDLAEGENGMTVSGFDQLHTLLESYACETGEIRQCSVTYRNAKGEELLYMGGDLGYKLLIVWVNREYTDEVLDVGPPDEDSEG